jgi:hypothetical protein
VQNDRTWITLDVETQVGLMVSFQGKGAPDTHQARFANIFREFASLAGGKPQPGVPGLFLQAESSKGGLS